MLQQLVDQAVEAGPTPGVVAAVARGDDVEVAVAGTAAVDGPPLRRDALFRLTSMTKPMTAAVVLSLIQDGRLALDEPVDRLLPELADRRVLRDPAGPLTETVPAERPVTVRDLLTFTFGFGMQGALFAAAEPWPIVAATEERRLAVFGPPEPATVPDPDTWLARLGELPLMAQPGERWLYHAGSQVLGVLAARAGGAPFDVVMRQRLLDPLGMTDTAFSTTDTDRLVTAYGSDMSVADRPDGQWSTPPAFPDGGAGLVSTVDDVVAFGRMLARGGDPVLTADTVAEMTRDQLTPQQRKNTWPGFDMLSGRGWGYGVSVLDDGGYSWPGGFGTMWHNEGDRTVVLLTQRGVDEEFAALGDRLIAAARRPPSG